MHIISLSDLLVLVETAKWKHYYEIHISGVTPIIRAVDGVDVQTKLVYGEGRMVSTLGEIILTHHEDFEYDENDEQSFQNHSDNIKQVLTIKGVLIHDDKGRVMDSREIEDCLPSRFSDINYNVLPVTRTGNHILANVYRVYSNE